MTKLSEILNKKGVDTMVPVIFLFKDGKVLLGLRNYTPDKWKKVSVWTIPGGRCDVGETLKETLRREVREEIGITDFDIDGYLGSVAGAKDQDLVFVFKGSTEQDPSLMEKEKFSDWKWVPELEIPENFINPAALELLRK